MSRLTYRASCSAFALWLCLAAAGSCSAFEASTPTCVDNGDPPCSGPRCKALRSACEKRARVCGSPRGECDIELCARDAARRIDQFANVDNAKRALLGCTTNAVACARIDACFEALDEPSRCADDEEQRRTTTAPVLPTRVPKSDGSGVAGLVVLPGDDLGCLRCAFESGGCGEQHPGCFSANPLAAGASDSCLDYRVCLRTCEQTTGHDARLYAQCAASACDVPDHAQGKLEFAGYRECMFEHCSSCFSTP